MQILTFITKKILTYDSYCEWHTTNHDTTGVQKYHLRILDRIPAQLHVGSVCSRVEACLCYLQWIFLGTNGCLQVVNVPLLLSNLGAHLGNGQEASFVNKHTTIDDKSCVTTFARSCICETKTQIFGYEQNLGVDDYRNCNAGILWYLNVLLLIVSAFHMVPNFHTVKMLTLLIHSGYLGAGCLTHICYLFPCIYIYTHRDICLQSHSKDFRSVCTKFDSEEVLKHAQSLACHCYPSMW